MTTKLSAEMKEKLLAEAKEVRKNAYVPYSNFAVGAALLAEDGTIFRGCNIENSSYGLTICAERNAIFNAVSQGYRKFKAMAVVCNSPGPCSPCGACRQVIAEFGGDIQLILANLAGEIKEVTASDLLPGFFRCEDIRSGEE